MGGVINVAIRFPDGRAVCHERWTNNMPHWFKSPKMFEGDPEHVNEYLALTRNNDYILDPYAPGKPQPVRNSEYGLIVWDFKEGVILDNNHYSSPIEMSVIEAMGSVSPERRENFLALAASGRIMLKRLFWTPSSTEYRTELHPLTEAEAIAEAKRLSEVERERWGNRKSQRMLTPDGEEFVEEFQINPRPMRYVYLGDHSERGNWEKYREHLKAIGFPMSSKEGLNAGEPRPPRKRNVTDQEKVARELFQRWKRQTPPDDDCIDGRKYDGVRFEDAPKDIQRMLLEKAAETSEEALCQMRFADLFA